MRRVMMVVCVGLIAASAVTGGGRQEAATGTPEVSVFWRIGAHSIGQENPIVQDIERLSGVRPVFLNVPWSAWAERLNLAVASGDMADITMNSGPGDGNVVQWVTEGIFMPLDDLIANAPNIQSRVPDEVMQHMVAPDGKTYWIPRLWVMPHTFLIRDDWLERYGVDAPETLEEFYDAGIRIRDGLRDDGREDAYAYGGFGFMFWSRWISAAFDLPINQYKMIDGELRYTSTVPEARQWVEYVKRLYEDGIMDPEFLVLNPSQGRERLYQGRIGMAGMRIDDVGRANSIFESAGLEARVSAYPPPRSAGGVGGYTFNTPLNDDGVGYWMTASIPARSRNAEAAMRLMDFMISEEGTILGFWGREDIEHRRTTDGRFEWLVGVDERERLGLPLYVNFLTGEPRYGEALDDPWSPEADEIYRVIADSLYRDFIVIPPTNERIRELQADLGTFVEENLVNFVTGARPIEQFDAFVDEWNRRGGRDLLQEMTRELERRNN